LLNLKIKSYSGKDLEDASAPKRWEKQREMICPNCGKEVPDDANFCKYCGVRLVEKAQLSARDIIRNTVIRRLECIRNRDSKTIKNLVDQGNYTKFDDWPPFVLQ